MVNIDDMVIPQYVLDAMSRKARLLAEIVELEKVIDTWLTAEKLKSKETNNEL